MFYDTENMLSLKGTDAQISLCSFRETTWFFFIWGVISQDYIQTQRHTSDSNWIWLKLFLYELYKQSFHKSPTAVGGKKVLDVGGGRKDMSEFYYHKNSLFYLENLGGRESSIFE